MTLMNARLRTFLAPCPDLGLDGVVRELQSVREQWRLAHDRKLEMSGREFPSRVVLHEIVERLCSALFPMRLGPADLRQGCSEDFYVGHTLDVALRALLEQVRLELRHLSRNDPVLPEIPEQRNQQRLEQRALSIVRQFAAELPRLRVVLDSDVEAAYRGDPAANSVDEIVLCYPGTLAIIHHRLAHALHRLGVPLIARIVSEIAHSATGIDIHPGAQIGSGSFIDHGTGVVVGETAVIGERVRLYQAVTLGAKRFTVGADGALEKGAPRHPIVEDDVVVYAGATILGRITIGKGSSIGGNVWLTHSVPPGSVITQASTRNELMENGAGI